MPFNRAETKEQAKNCLGNNLFGKNWMMALLISLLFSIITNVVPLVFIGFFSYGLHSIFLKAARNPSDDAFDVSDLFKGFQEDAGRNFLIGLMSNIFIFLWTLLFIIPGVVKSYSYSMVYYIAVDNPELSWNECITKSKMMMVGKKWDLFVLDLSFIGWYIVGSICLWVGVLWVVPYHYQARTIFYEKIKIGNFAE